MKLVQLLSRLGKRKVKRHLSRFDFNVLVFLENTWMQLTLLLLQSHHFFLYEMEKTPSDKNIFYSGMCVALVLGLLLMQMSTLIRIVRSAILIKWPRVSRDVWYRFFSFLQVLQKFPDGLQYEIHLHMHLTVLSDSFLFHDFDDSCQRALAKKMHRHHHLPGHQILHDGDDIDSVHLVRRGKIDIMFDGKQRGRISKLSLKCFLFKSWAKSKKKTKSLFEIETYRKRNDTS